MKVLNVLFGKQRIAKTTLSLTILLLSIVAISSCEKSEEKQIAEERFIVTNLAINATPELPLLIGRDSLLDISNGPENASNGKLLWESSNPAIATVDDFGRVKAVSVGEATIKVSSTDGGARASSILVQVIDRIEYATAISIVPGSLSIFEAEKATLAATIAPANVTYKTLKWTSSNAGVATVSASGEVTGIAKGNVIITAATTDGSGVSKTVAVEIKEVIPLTAISITTVINETVAVGQTTQLEYSYMPANASVQSMIWTSSDPAIATVSETGLIRGIAAGNATITVESKTNSTIKSSININVEAGKINDTFIDGVVPNWITSTSGASVLVQDNKLMVTMNTGTNRRGDFRRPNTTLHIGNYPIIAFKFVRPLPTGGNVFLDTNMGRWRNGANNMTRLVGSDGIQVLYADLGSFNSFGATGFALPTTATYTFTQLTVGVADMPTAQNPISPYPVYWVKTFKNVGELQAYINQ
jgi:uncharacterized protein YjdB